MQSFLAFAATTTLIFAGAINTEEVLNFRMCRNTKCEISNLFINPCPEALRGKPCEIPQGVNASITYNFRPKFGSTKPATRLYAETLLVDLPFMDMDTNACLYTSCPVVANATASWDYKLFVANSYPKGQYTVKSKLWGAEAEANSKDECCFKFDMKIV